MPRASQITRFIPSAVLADGPLIVPLFAVTTLSLSESYHLPPIGSDAGRVLVETHDDTITLSAALIGPDRFVWKLFLETVAEQSMRGSVLDGLTGGKVGGLILWTGLTLRTDIFVKSLNFTTSASRRDAIDVSITLEHLPRPGALSKLLDIASVAVSSIIDPFI
ncbi:MAG: hypothetical protein RL885_20490 [Planctomycetota bacterium]